MKKTEMHCHSTCSDGKNSLGEVLAEAERRGLEFLALTDHDVISPQDFQKNLRDSGVETCDSVEISARNYDLGKSLHLVSYAGFFQDSLKEVLQYTRDGKREKNRGQIEKLILEFGFEGSVTAFDAFMKETKHRSPDTANGFDISCFMMLSSGNREKVMRALNTLKEKDGKSLEEGFFYECLKRGGQLYEIYGYEIPEYEPSVQQTVEHVVQKSGGIVSLAHPNVTFNQYKGGIPEFERTIGNYVEKGVNAIEINAQASPQWVEIILQTQREFDDILLTFGSDCHQIGYDGRDGKHASIGQMNPHVSPDLVERNFGEFLERVK